MQIKEVKPETLKFEIEMTEQELVTLNIESGDLPSSLLNIQELIYSLLVAHRPG